MEVRLPGLLGLVLALAGLLLLFAFGMPYQLRTGGAVGGERKYALLGWAALALILAGSLLQAYPVAKAPEPKRDSVDFVIRQEPVAPLIARVCARTERLKGEQTCYRDEWSDPVKALAATTMGQEAKGINGDSEVEMPADSVVTYPDGGTRLLFEGCRAHACTTANVYFLVTPDGASVDILWGSERGVKSLGPNAGLLAGRKVYERLQEIKCRKMFPNLNPCKIR
jgi:hypothetical protein